jgi:hypothetical protein
MTSSADVISLTPDGSRTGEGPDRTDTLIKAALSLSQAITALGSLQLLGELQPPDVKGGINFYREVRRFEVALILEALRQTHGSQARAAALLGLNPTTLNCMLKRYDINSGLLTARPASERPRRRRRAKSQPTPTPATVRHELAHVP